MKVSTQQAWAIIRYMPVAGGFPDEDPCAFDGWYFVEALAQGIYKDWCRRYPDWIVALVIQQKARVTNKEITLPPAVRAQLRVLHGDGWPRRAAPGCQAVKR